MEEPQTKPPEDSIMSDQKKIREKIKEMRELVRVGKERIATHSPVWAVYLTGETLRSLSQVLDALDRELDAPVEKEWNARARRTG